MMLVDYGADPNARAVIPPSLYSGTALQQAAGGGEAVVRTLFGAGADPNMQCGHYSTMLHLGTMAAKNRRF